MIEIKTIESRENQYYSFDEVLKELLNDGWEIIHINSIGFETADSYIEIKYTAVLRREKK